MSPSLRMNWVGLSIMLAVLVFGLATRPSGSQLVSAPLATTTTTSVLGCNRCPWWYKYVTVPQGTPGQPGPKVQIVPIGESGTLHRLYGNGVVLVGEGDSNNPSAPHVLSGEEVYTELDLAFADGLWVQFSSSFADTTIIYRVDSSTTAGCNRCRWSYRHSELFAGQRVQIAPVGTAGVLHRLPYRALVTVGEGDASAPGSPTVFVGALPCSSCPSPTDTALDLAFSDGLWIQSYASGEFTTLYRLNSPLPGGIVDPAN